MPVKKTVKTSKKSKHSKPYDQLTPETTTEMLKYIEGLYILYKKLLGVDKIHEIMMEIDAEKIIEIEAKYNVSSAGYSYGVDNTINEYIKRVGYIKILDSIKDYMDTETAIETLFQEYSQLISGNNSSK